MTVGLTTHERPALLALAMASVLGQTYRDLELYVVDDYSRDGTPDVVVSFDDPRVEYIRQQSNVGAVVGRNAVLHRAAGKYIAFIDDDDAWEPDKLAQQVALAEGPAAGCAVVYCGASIVLSGGNVLGSHRPNIRGPIREAVAAGRLNTVPSAHLFRTDLLREIGGYDTALPSHNEHDIWMEMARRGHRADYVDLPLVRVGHHTGYRMTTDIELRWSATQLYFDKWRPFLESWMGRRRARDYEVRYFARAVGAAGREALRHGRFLTGLGVFARIVRRWPLRLAAYSTVARMMAGALRDGVPFGNRV